MTDHNEARWALVRQLAVVLSERTDAATRDRIALRDAVCAFVAAEHARATPLSGVIATVKKILREAEVKPSVAGATDELAAQLIAWCREFHKSAGLLSS